MNKDKWKNSSTKGYIGQSIVEVDLLKRGYNVYKPLVDDDGVDMLTESIKSNKIRYTTIQVKYSESFDSLSSIRLDVKKSRADYIALVFKDECNTEVVLYIKNKDKVSRWTRSIQIKKSKNNQRKGVHSYKRYLNPRF